MEEPLLTYRGAGRPGRPTPCAIECGRSGGPAFRRGSPLRRLARSLLPALIVLGGLLAGQGAARSETGTRVPDEPAKDDVPPDAAEGPFVDPFGTGDPFAMETTNWDSVFAAVDRDFDRARGWIEPLVDLSYDKVAGLHIDGGAALGPLWNARVGTATRFGYDFGRSKPTGRGSVRYGDLDRETWWLGVELHSGISSFGSHQPYTNTLLAFVGGYDARAYLREEGGEVRASWKPTAAWTLQTAAIRTHQAPSPLRASYHLFGSDRWMEENAGADGMAGNLGVDRWTGTGVLVQAEHRPRYSDDVVLPGLYARGAVASYRGALSSGPEFSRWTVQAKRLWQPRGRDEFYVIADLGITAGHAPIQFAQDLGGQGGLRGFEPRFVTGNQRIFVRSQFAWANRKLGQIKLPVFGKTKLRLVPFAEVGSVWGDPSVGLGGRDLVLPDPSEIHWDLGLGLRRIVDSSGLLSYLQVDFAWPMGADTGPARITLMLSSRGFD